MIKRDESVWDPRSGSYLCQHFLIKKHMKSVKTKGSLKILGLMLMFVLVMNAFNIPEVDGATTLADVNQYTYRILEIQPGSSFELGNLNTMSHIQVDQLQMSEFIGLRQDLKDLYDIIYIGDNGTDYTYLGQTMTRKLTHLALTNYSNQNQGVVAPAAFGGLPQYEYKQANDITDLKAHQVIDFIDNGGLVYIDEEDFNQEIFKNTKLYKNFSGFYNTPHSRVRFTSSPLSDIRAVLGSSTAYQQAGGKYKPYVALTQRPTEFTGAEATFITANVINFRYNIKSYTDPEGLFAIKLFFDMDGDGYYEDSELVDQRTGVEANDNLLTTISVPDDFMGVQPWKLEVIDETTHMMRASYGYAAFANGDPIPVNVLQIYPNSNTFNLETELNDSTSSLLDVTSSGYDINVDVMSIGTFNHLYDDPNFSIIDYEGPSGETYDMLIMGFSDTYGGSDIASEAIADDLKAFIATGQSMMLTHDTVTFRYMYGKGTSPGNWSVNITQYMRDAVGQNIFVHEETPIPNTLVHGFSDFLQKRGDGIYGDWQTTTKVKQFNDGVLTEFPYNIPEILTVATTHIQWFQLDLEDPEVLVWYTLTGKSSLNDKDPRSYYYTYSKGNVTYSGTGHTDMSNTSNYDERRLFVNTMVKAIRGANLAPTVSITGLTSGDMIAKSTEAMDIGILAKDPNLNNQQLVGRVYVDYNNDGSYSDDEIVKEYNPVNGYLTNGIEDTISLDFTKMAMGVDEIHIKAIVYDGLAFGQGAKGETTSDHPYLDMPTINMTKVISNMMVGETQTIDLDLNLSPITATMGGSIDQVSVHESVARVEAGGTVSLNLLNHEMDVANITGWTAAADHLSTSYGSPLNIAPGLTWHRSLTYRISGEKEGSYRLSSDLSYRYSLGATDMVLTPSLDRTLKVYKGFYNMILRDDTGASIVKDVQARLYRVKDRTGTPVTKTEIAYYTVDAGNNYVYGDEDSEILTSGYYVIETEGVDGYDPGISGEFLIEPTDSGHYRDVPIILNSKPIANVHLTHLVADSSDPTGYRVDTTVLNQQRVLMDKIVGSVDYSQGYYAIDLDVVLSIKSLKMVLEPMTPSGSTDLNHSLVKVIDPSGNDVTALFSQSGNSITGVKASGLLEGNYRIIMKGDLPVSGFYHGDLYNLGIDSDMEVVTLLNVTNTIPIAKPDPLKFTVLVEILKDIL